MMRIFIVSCFCLTLILLFVMNRQTVKVIQYFPPSETVYISEAKTRLTQDQKTPNFTWTIDSNTSEKAYLRQDISLLYVNGMYKGVMQKWRQNTDFLQSSKEFNVDELAIIQAITFHHAEIHHPNDETIHSSQMMSADELYHLPGTLPSTKQERQLIQEINQQTDETLAQHWQALINHANIPAADYLYIPITSLVNYESSPLPGKTMEETSKIIGQLWEGIYKKYAVILRETQSPHVMPIILFDAAHNQLILLFQLDDEIFHYIQQVS